MNNCVISILIRTPFTAQRLYSLPVFVVYITFIQTIRNFATKRNAGTRKKNHTSSLLPVDRPIPCYGGDDGATVAGAGAAHTHA